MSKPTQYSAYNTCAFCRTNKKSWNHPMKDLNDAVVCSELLNTTCLYCKGKGHTKMYCKKLADKIKLNEEQAAKDEQERHARWEHNRKVRESEIVLKQEKQKQLEEAKANSWASKAAKVISDEERIKNDEFNEKLKQAEIQRRQDAIRKKEVERQLEQKRWEERYVWRMMKFYGLPEAYGDFPAGSFWEFFVEGRHFNGQAVDHELAKSLRDSEENQTRFINYLKIKYYDWLYQTEETSDDCLFVWRLREKDRQEIEQRNWQHEKYMEEREMQREKEEQDEKAEMKRKLKAGEITQKEYQEWEWQKEDELSDFLEFSSFKWYDYHIAELQNKRAWQTTKDKFEQQKK